MKILLCHTSLGSGGIESMVVNLANEIAKSQDITVCTIFQPKETDVCFNKLSSKVKFIALGKSGRGISIKHLFNIIKEINRGRYDVVHLNGFFYYYFLAIVLLHRRIRFFYTVHNDAIQENCLWDCYLLPLKKFCFKHGWMHAITISKTSQKSFVNLYKSDNTLIYNGVPKPHCKKVDVAHFRFTNNTRIMLNPARISEQKNQIMLCKAAQRLINEGFDSCLLIVGANNDEQIYSQLEPYFSNRIVYLGERNDVVDIMNSVEAMCLSSKWEGMPVTLIEALSVGCIPICTPVGGICDVIQNDINGILSSDTSEEAYYQSMKRFMQMNPDKLNDISKQCRSSFSKFDIEMTADQYLNIFKQTI